MPFERLTRCGAMLLAFSLPALCAASQAPTPAAIMGSFKLPEAPQKQPQFKNAIPDVKPDPIEEAADVTFTLTKLTISGNTVLSDDDIIPLYEDYIGQEITPKTLSEIAAQLTALYRNRGYILSRAYVPPQQIEKGHATIQVVEGFIEKVVFRWMDMLPDHRIKFYANRIKKIRPIHQDDIERALLLIKELPGMKVSGTLRPSRLQDDAADLVIVVSRKPMKVTLDVANENTKSLGEWRGMGVVEINNYLNQNERLSLYGALPSSPFKRMMLYGAEFSMPIGLEGATINLKAELLRTEPQLSIPNTRSQGRVLNMSVGATYPLILNRGFSWRIAGYFDAKQSTSKLWTNGYVSENNFESLRILRLENTLDFTDAMRGSNLFNLSVHQGMKSLGARKKTPSGKVGELSFTKFTGSYARLQHIWQGLYVYKMIRGQYAAMPLLSLERFNFGGPPYNHIYPSGFLSGDMGYEAVGEIRYNHHMHGFWHFVQVYAGYHYGQIYNKKPYPGQRKTLSAPGASFGIKLGFEPGFNVMVTYGVPTKNRIDGIKVKNQVYASLGYSSRGVGDAF